MIPIKKSCGKIEVQYTSLGDSLDASLHTESLLLPQQMCIEGSNAGHTGRKQMRGQRIWSISWITFYKQLASEAVPCSGFTGTES